MHCLVVVPNNNPIKHAHHACSLLFAQILLHLLPGLWRSADLWQLCSWILWPPLWKVRHYHSLFLLFFFLVFCLSWSSGHCCVIVVTGRAGSKVSKGLAVASSGFEFRWKGYKHVCGWHLLFIISMAVVIECCQWRDGSCKSVPPILMCLDVRYSVLFFFFQICWWILFSWIYWIEQKKMKGSFSLLCRLSSLRFFFFIVSGK